MSTMATLQVKLHNLRVRNGYTFRKLAKLTGFNISTLHTMETRETNPTKKTLQKLASVYGVKLSTLLD